MGVAGTGGACRLWGLDWLSILVKRKALGPYLLEGPANLNQPFDLGSTWSNPLHIPNSRSQSQLNHEPLASILIPSAISRNL